MVSFRKLSAVAVSGLVLMLLPSRTEGQNVGTEGIVKSKLPQKRSSMPLPAQTSPMPLVAPLFIEDEEFTSTLVLVNPTTQNRPATVILRNLQGKTIVSKNVLVPGEGRLDISVGKILRSVSSSDTTGSLIVLRKGRDITAALSLTDHRQNAPVYLDEELMMPMQSSSPMLRAAADGTEESTIIAITSLASTTQHVTMRCLAEHGSPILRKLDLSPNATVLSRACLVGSGTADDFEIMGTTPEEIAGHHHHHSRRSPVEY